MIVDMKEVFLFITPRSREKALEQLRGLGVLHIEYLEEPVSYDVNQLEEQLREVDNAISLIETEEFTTAANQPETTDLSGEQLTAEINQLNQQQKSIQEQLNEKQQLLEWFDTWGKIDQNEVEKLADSGIYLKFYQAEKDSINSLDSDLTVYRINYTQNLEQLLLIAEDPDQQLSQFQEILPPSVSFDQTVTSYQNLQEQLTEIKHSLSRLADKIASLYEYRATVEERLEFARVKSGMADSENIHYLRGYCPQKNILELAKTAEEAGWGYLSKEPDDPRQVPTLLSDTVFTRLVDPIYRFMGTLPGYNELDISGFFLIFFAIFVAMIVSDAGYGLVYLGLTLFAQKRFSSVPKATFKLFYILSGATIIWGIFTGSFFGIEAIQELPPFRYIIIDQLNFFAEDHTVLMFITFIVGAVQLILGHLMQLIKAAWKPQALAEIGWIAVVAAMLFVSEKIVLGSELFGESITYQQLAVIIAAGGALVLLFENYRAGAFFRGVISTVTNLPMDIISAFSDIVSYIRLFAVGLATVVIMTSFNEMAVAGGIDGAGDLILAVIILLLGHGLNLVLCLMSIVVHGIRLNMLEFSNHVGLQWTGRRYKPFKRQIIQHKTAE